MTFTLYIFCPPGIKPYTDENIENKTSIDSNENFLLLQVSALSRSPLE